jgi:hypothetical protein
MFCDAKVISNRVLMSKAHFIGQKRTYLIIQ